MNGLSQVTGGKIDTLGGQMVPDWLTRRALLDGQREALRFYQVSFSYEELWRAATRLSLSLSEQGIQAHQRVAVLIHNGRDYSLAVHGLMQLGVVLVPLNWRLTASEMAWQVRDVQAEWLLHDLTSASEAEKITAETGVPLLRIEDFLGEQVGTAESIEDFPGEQARNAEAHAVSNRERLIDLSRPFAVIYTSGTTGKPKGTVLTYGNFWWSAMASALQFGMQKDDEWLVPMPLFHVGGLSVLIRSLIYGTTAVIHDHFDVQLVNNTIDEEGITLLSVVPTMLSSMLEERGPRPYPKRLRLVLLGGSSAPRTLLEKCHQLEVPVAQSYGLTEACSQVATLLPQDGLRKLGSSGKPLFPTRVKIVSADGLSAFGPSITSSTQVGEMGEIAVSGPTVMPGYWNRDNVNAERFSDGWFLTGDIGYFDEEGYLYVVDRRNDLIVSGGENIYPAEVEAVLMLHPQIAEAGVVGVESDKWGQVPIAVVRFEDGQRVSDTELDVYCRQYLAGYKVPCEFHATRESLPRNASGKLLRRALKTQVTK